MQERITTTKKGSITSVQAIYVPADDLTDPPPPPPLPILTPPLYCPEVSPSEASTPPWIPSTPPPVSWIPTSSVSSTTKLPVASRSPSRTSLLSSVWTSCPRRTRSRLPGRGRSRGSFHSPSRSPRCSPARRVSL